MKLCNACRRHVRPAEGACPFCGEVLRAAPATRVGMVVLLGTLGSSCTSRPVEDTATGGGSTAGSDSDTSSGSTDGTSTVSPTSTSTSTSSTTTTSTSFPSTGIDTTGIDPSTGQQSSVSDSESGDSGCSFYGGACVDFSNPNECDQWAQDCPEGEKCTAFSSDGDSSWDALQCVPVPPNPGQIGDVCTSEGVDSGVDSCGLGLMCWDIDKDTEQGHCVAFCTGTPDMPVCDSGSTCVIANQGVLSLCLPACNPLLQDCQDDDLCIPNPNNDQEFTCIFPGGEPVPEFGACEFANSCAPGLACLGPELAVECDQNSPGCCAAFCDVTNPMCTGMNQECVGWFEMGMDFPGLENLGVCRIPG
jgi:hypothetical protein